MDLDKIKAEWAALKIENSDLQRKNIELTRRLATTSVANNQQKLARSYRIGYMGFAFPGLAVIMYQLIHASVALCIIYAVYGLILGSFDLWFMRFIKKVDYTTIPTVDALEHVSKVVIYQNWATVASLIAGACVLVPFFYEMSLLHEESVVWGGIVGGIIGGTIGAIKCIKNHRLARQMLAELRNVKTPSSDIC